MEIRKVGVLGCGLMGSGIAQVAAQSGHPTTVLEVSKELLDAGLKRIDQFLSNGVSRGKVRPEEKQATLSRLAGTTDYAALADCDLVIEAVVENLAAKQEAFQRLERTLKPEAILASNTSSLSITEMSVATKRPQRFVKLVEITRTIQTDPEVEETVLKFAKGLGKVPIRALDRTGFIVNRLLVPYILDAIRALEEGVGTIVDIDQGMKLGCGHPMGPFTLLDLVGIDTTYYIANIMFDEFRERRFAPPPLMKRMVLAGFHGRKTGKGFYDYASEPPKPNDFLTRS